MPIVSRVLTLLANREDLGPGVKVWRADGVDGRDQKWYAGPMTATQAEAEVMRDAAWPTKQLQDHDESIGMEFIEAGGEPEVYAREDMTLQEWRRRVAKRWWNTPIKGAIGKDFDFLCLVADYITTFTAAQIASALGISETMATKGLDRAVDLRDVTCPAMIASDIEQEDV